MAIKESGPVFLAPTLEKAIDILKNSEVFNKFQNQMKPEDQVTSELISSLMNVSRNIYFFLLTKNQCSIIYQ